MIHCELINGPQDGSKVIIQDNHPKVIFVQLHNNGDGAQPWRREKSELYSSRYILGHGYAFLYTPRRRT